MALFITFLLGFFFLIGAVIIKLTRQHYHERMEHISLALAFGALIVIAVGDILPEIVTEYQWKFFWIPIVCVVAGVALLQLLDLFIPEHNDSDEEESEENFIHIGLMATVAIVLHNILEGVTVYTMATESPASGLALALGVGLHNIPMGMMIYSTLETESRKHRYAVTFAAFISTFVGGFIMFLMQNHLNEMVLGVLLCIALGMVIFILIFELLPSIRHDQNKKQAVISMLIGAAIVGCCMLISK